MQKFLSIILFFSLFSVIFHFHNDFSHHTDCPVCVFEVEDGKVLSIKHKDISFHKENITIYSFSNKESILKNYTKLISYPRAPPVKNHS